MSDTGQRGSSGSRLAPIRGDRAALRLRRAGPYSRPEALDRLAEWAALHHRLHEVLGALAPFASTLARAQRCGRIDAVDQSELFVNWRPCQREINELVEFGEGISYIARPFHREAHRMGGARWAVEVVALRLMIEGSLAERHPHVGSLVELVYEFRSACHRHLAIANRQLRDLVGARRQAPGGGVRE